MSNLDLLKAQNPMDLPAERRIFQYAQIVERVLKEIKRNAPCLKCGFCRSLFMTFYCDLH